MKYAIVGLGPVGRRIADSARANGHSIACYDIDDSRTDGWPKGLSVESIVEGADRIVSAVPASAAQQVALETAANSTSADGLYEDWTSAAPQTKVDLARLIGQDRYIDVSLLDSITVNRPQLCIAGKARETVARELSSLNFDVVVSGPAPGDAATVKMIRSSFMKPLEVLAIELLRVSRLRDPSGAAISSIERTLQQTFSELASMLLTTNRIHAGRRVEELNEAMGAVGSPFGAPLLSASARALAELRDIWAKPDAPQPDADAETLIAYLLSPSGLDDMMDDSYRNPSEGRDSS